MLRAPRTVYMPAAFGQEQFWADDVFILPSTLGQSFPYYQQGHSFGEIPVYVCPDCREYENKYVCSDCRERIFSQYDLGEGLGYCPSEDDPSDEEDLFGLPEEEESDGSFGCPEHCPFGSPESCPLRSSLGPLGNPEGSPFGGSSIGSPSFGSPFGSLGGSPFGGSPIGSPGGSSFGSPFGSPSGSPYGGPPFGSPGSSSFGGSSFGSPLGSPAGSPYGGPPFGIPGGSPYGGFPFGTHGGPSYGGSPLGSAVGVPFGNTMWQAQVVPAMTYPPMMLPIITIRLDNFNN